MWQNRRRLQAKSAKAPKDRDLLLSALRWVLGLSGTLYLAWLLLFPGLSGSVGRWLAGHLFGAFGGGAYLLPVLFANALVKYFRAGKDSGWIITTAAAAFALLSACALLAIVGGWLSADPRAAGGSAGAALRDSMTGALGAFGAFAACATILVFCAQIVFAIRWSKVIREISRILAEDYQAWQRSRKELAQLALSAKASTAGAQGERSSAVLENPSRDAVARETPKPPERIEPSPDRKKKAAAAVAARPAAAPPAGSPYADYQLPSVQLLNAPPPAKDRGKPLESEISASIALLESTLKSFEIDARVTGYAPGPVITRYELAPAPGVKVSSIVSLENDIALAMSAKGIRIIAPIPGKAAVGIEIPNARPALVVLREILESPALPPEAPLLSFALGLASDGQPKSADLQKMPHVLIAGATNSGKSVSIHSLILSILFRARPDEVKFMMIDPKRLELTFYDGIPHLFDPTATADKVSVVTSPKDAAKALTALVKLMERRYEEFQLFGVRNIDSYNREADARGKPRAFFIVVVIDELADLMLVAQDTVEDSIQRLTQMARAVGIHLVLATQRPSVDVITGVIKANLPCRIALQVISKIDSKVILDCTGAESLQGKGDLLYLAAGAQKPERCQGAYVSEDEINRTVAHLRAQGKPDYPLLETMAKEASADLSSFGVDPLEFSQALKLVLERKRVSQDLLKSQFGSSARATNLLSALEVKEMIHKPEGSNRWEIHFDLIEDYLRKHFPQVPLDGR